jgi:hypothetical protein
MLTEFSGGAARPHHFASNHLSTATERPTPPIVRRHAHVLRISGELWEGLQRMAAQELRSVNAQIEYLLREAVSKHGRRITGASSKARKADES